MDKTKRLRSKKNFTRKNTNVYGSSFKIKKINNIITKENANKLKEIISEFFENEILSKINNCPRPVKKTYGDFVERSKGRFEIIPPTPLENKIWKILLENERFLETNNEIKEIITKNNGKCIEELCILPVEPNTRGGVWHRDIFLYSKKDFERNPYYITQLIYLDDKANTKFCINSQNNSDNNVELYTKQTIKAQPLSSVIFDGRTLHKGLKNYSKYTRYAIYISYFDSSYVDKESVKPPILHKKTLC